MKARETFKNEEKKAEKKYKRGLEMLDRNAADSERFTQVRKSLMKEHSAEWKQLRSEYAVDCPSIATEWLG